MKNCLSTSALFIALIAGAAPAAAQRDTTPNWDVLLRPRARSPRPTAGAITPSDLMTRLYIFADDSMQGRLLGTAGNVRGVEYIAAEAKRLRLVPMGDNGTYFQTVGVFDRMVDSTSRLAVGSATFTPWTDFVLRDQGPLARDIAGVPVIFGGTWGDDASLIEADAARGKLVVLKVAPDAYMLGSPGGVIRAAVTRRFLGAAGIAVASMDDIPRQMIAIYREPTQIVKSGDDPPPLPSFLYVTKRVAAALLGTGIDSVKKGAAGVTVTTAPRIVEVPLKYPARNVVAMIPGSGPRLSKEFVAIGAHNDHIGWETKPVAHDSIYVVNHLYRRSGAEDLPPQLTPDQQAIVNAIVADVRRRSNGASARLDSIYNGADDDGSGSVSVLEIAQYFASQKVKPKRSLLFVWHVGEEEGLYGSEWFTDHPTVPRDSIVSQLNIDMIGRGSASDITGVTKEGAKVRGNADYLQLIGSRRLSTELGDLAEAVDRAEKKPLSFDYTLDANGHPQIIYCRSDHYEYARYGIPIVFFTTGGHADYHQFTDEPQYIDYDRMARVAQFVANLATRVGNLEHRPLVDKPKPDPHGRCVQ